VNWSAIWDEHRRFILAVLAALVAFFVADSILGSIFFSPAEREGLREKRLAQTLRTRRAPTRADIDAATQKRDELRRRYVELRSRLEFETSPAYELAAAERDFDVFYNTVFQRTREEIVEAAAALDIDVDPTLGLPEGTPGAREEAREQLRALDVVRHVCLAAIGARVDAVREIRYTRAALSPARGSGGSWGEAPFLRETEVGFSITGNASALAVLLEAIQTAKNPVVLKDARIEVDRRNPQLAHADFRAVALEFEAEAP
jgi:hypothetical protein